VVSADIANGSDLRLFGTYVQSPLCWAISTGQASAFNTVEDLKGQARTTLRAKNERPLLSNTCACLG
jgi:hypothetical protein